MNETDDVSLVCVCVLNSKVSSDAMMLMVDEQWIKRRILAVCLGLFGIESPNLQTTQR